MSIASLANFTVPLDSTGTLNQGLLMPKLKYRFRVTLLNFGLAGSNIIELTKQVQDCTRPSVSFEDITIDVYNSKVKLAGKPSWEDVTLTVRDDATGQITRLIGQQLQQQFDFLEMASAASGIDYKFIAQIDMLDGGNGVNNNTAGAQVLETWQLYGCFLQQANYGDMAYGESGPVTIALTLRFDNALQLNTQNGEYNGVGLNAGRTLGSDATGVKYT
jgi:hypothetical protein